MKVYVSSMIYVYGSYLNFNYIGNSMRCACPPGLVIVLLIAYHCVRNVVEHVLKIEYNYILNIK